MISDVVIVGGGPAACSTALTLQRQGLDVIIVAAIARNQKPTETASPRLRQILESIGATSALTACEPCLGICSAWGRKSLTFESSISNPFGHGWFIHRGRFDLVLRELVRAVGITWASGRALSVVFGQKGVCVSTENANFRAKWVVFAMGSLMWPAKMTEQIILAHDSLAAYWAELPIQVDARVVFLEPSNEGWWYACPNDGDGAIMCLVTDVPTARSMRLMSPSVWHDLFRKTKIFRQFQSGRAPSRVLGATVSLATLPRTAGRFWTAVGDSAMKLDPLGSFGTIGALESGRRAGEAIADALQGRSQRIEQFERWSKSLFAEFLRQRSKQYALEKPNHDAGFWRRRN